MGMLQTLEIAPCKGEGGGVPESCVSWRFRVEAMAGFVMAHFPVLGVTFIILLYLLNTKHTSDSVSFRYMNLFHCHNSLMV